MVKDVDDGLSSKDLSSIRRTVLDARELIEKDIERQLERYGIYEDLWMDKSELKHLDRDDLEIRNHIDAALEREMKATDEDDERSYHNYVKGATYHTLNRLFALKMLEERGIVAKTLARDPDYGNRSYLHKTFREVAGELCDSDDEGFKHALDLVYAEVGEEIGLIFEENEYTVIDLDFKVRNDVIELLNSIELKIWEADETIGWMYQYFGEKEREEIDVKIKKEKYKVQDTDVGVKTQLFTPRYIVEWMVDNSLGRLWLEMHPESKIDDEDKCFYLAPLKESLIEREPKDVREIKVLDPSCGSGHMLLYAFDVLYNMYLEEGNVPEKYIPREILKNNLYGIDIDPHAVQMAALALFIKAKSKEHDVEIEQMNLVPANAVLVNGDKKEEILSRSNELERKVLEEVWKNFQNVREFGSLIRIEKNIEKVIEEERTKLGKTGQSKFDFDKGTMISQAKFMDERGVIKSWDEVKGSILDKVKRLAVEALEHNNPVEKMFAGEVEKSVELLDLFVQEYDVVVTNPPYLGSAKMGKGLKKFVKDNYMGSRDLYTAFIERCTEFTNKSGYISMVTPDNFMFLYSYRKLRKNIISHQQIIEANHLSGYSFPPKDRPFTIPFILRNKSPTRYNHSRFYRMTHEQERYADHRAKITGLLEITKANRDGIDHDDVYVVDQNSFKEIGRTPFVYWFGQEILQIFVDNPSIDDLADVKQGLATGDDDSFVRKWWELSSDYDEEKWVPFAMGGRDDIYFDTIQNRVNWENEGYEIKNLFDENGKLKSRPQNEEYYFKEGLRFRDFSKYFVSRRLPNDSLPSHTIRMIYPLKGVCHKYLLAYLNSSLVRFIMDGINPSLHFNVGDGKRIPIKKSIENERICDLAEIGVESTKDKQSLIEVNPEFYSMKSYLNQPKLKLPLFNIGILESNVQVIHGLLDHIVFGGYDFSKNVKDRIYENLPKNLADYPHITNAGELNTKEYDFRAEISTKELPDDEYSELVNKIASLADKDLREISEELEISPYTVAMVKHKHDLYTKDEKEEAAGRLLSYYLGCIMGRWELDGLEPDENGILVFDETFDDDLIDRIRECIELSFGDEAYEKEREIEDMLGKSIEDWMKNNYFRYHHCKEYRRRGQKIPIYWQLKSDGGAFDCFVYYHKMDRDTFPKIKGHYLDEMLNRTENRLRMLENKLKDDSLKEARKKELRAEIEELLEKIHDLDEYGERLDKIIKDEFEPDFELGIWKNIKVVDGYDLLAVPLDKL